MEPMLIIDPFDGVTIRTANMDVLPLRNEKARALLGYLSFKPDLIETRERIAGLLWSETGEERARGAMRQCIRQLKVTLQDAGIEGLAVGRQFVGLTRGTAKSRTQIIEEDLARGSVDPLLTDEAGRPERLFYGFEDIDPSLAIWVHVARQSWRNRMTSALEALLEGGANPEVAVQAAQALVFHDPSHEPAHRQLISSYASSGNTAAALRQYDLLWHELREVHDSEPLPETVSLIAAIKMGQAGDALRDAPGPSVLAVAAGRAPVIELRAFRNLPGHSEMDYMIAGFRSELMASLVRFREWVLTDTRDGALAAAGPSPDFAIEAECSDFSGPGRFVVTLKEVASGRLVWSEAYTVLPHSFGRALRQIVRRIALALNIFISAERVAQTAHHGDADWAIFDDWLYGQSLSFDWTADSRDQAESIFKKIISAAPDFVPAYSSLVMLENTRHLAFPGVMRSEERQRETLSLAQRAVAMDPLDTKTHLAAAWSMAMNGRYAQAQQYFAQSYELNPNDPWTIVSAALGLAFSGALDDGMRLAHEALQFDQYPSPSHCEYQANIHFLAGDYEACCEWGERARGATHDSSGWQVASLAHLGRIDEAASLGRQFVDELRHNWRGPAPPDDRTIVGWFLQCFPLARPEALDRLRSGLARAGLGVE